jgi:hypothetical protein
MKAANAFCVVPSIVVLVFLGLPGAGVDLDRVLDQYGTPLADRLEHPLADPSQRNRFDQEILTFVDARRSADRGRMTKEDGRWRG